jgi:hypothetical protein
MSSWSPRVTSQVLVNCSSLPNAARMRHKHRPTSPVALHYRRMCGRPPDELIRIKAQTICSTTSPNSHGYRRARRPIVNHREKLHHK